MLRQFLVAAVVSVCNITIHALVMAVVVEVAQKVRTQHALSPSMFLIALMVATVSVLMAAHASEVVVWAIAYKIVGVVPAGGGNLYFAFVNYTTLGYGDIIPAKTWQLLGPAAAMNGVLLFGWSTAVIFEVLRRAMTLDSATTA
jgi:hypothetical protein